MKLRCVIGLLLLCSTAAAFGQQGVLHGSWIGHLFGYGFLFQVAAVVHWSRKRPEAFWLWIIIIGGIIAALAYFLIEGLPDLSTVQRTLRGPTRRKRIRGRRGLAEFELHEDEAAVADLRRVTTADPKYGFWRAASLLGQALARLGRTDEA